MWNFCLKFLIFQELSLIIDTWNLCHWSWHISNPKYIVPLKPFWCIFPSQNQQNVKFLPEILIFWELLIVETWNKCHWIWHTSNPKYIHSSHYDAFSQSKSTKCEIFGWNFDFLGIAYCRDLKPVPLDLAHLKPSLNMCHSSHFDAFFPVKINKMWNFCLKFWFLGNHLL